MKKALVIGASGLIGTQLIQLLLADGGYTVIALVRKKLPVEHEQLNQIQFDFDDAKMSIPQVDEVFCCLGTTIKVAGSKAQFYKVDFEYVLNITKAAFKNGAKKMAIVSSMGADKNSTIFYNRTKGEIEAAVTKIGYQSLFIFRPSILLGKRDEFRLGEMTGRVVMTFFAFAIPNKYKPIEASTVAAAMILKMNSDNIGLQIVASDQIADLIKTA